MASAENLKGKVALVTGSTTGIGRGIAHALACRGCSVVLTGLCTDEEADALLGEFQSAYSGTFHFVPGDLSDTHKTEKLAQDVLDIYPNGLNILVNNAGIAVRGLIETLSVDDWQKSLTVNLTAPFILIKAFLPLMKKNGWGRILLTSSQMGLIADPEKANYCACKAALLGIARVVTIEAAEFGVTCNAICPGYVDAPMGQSLIAKEAELKGVSYEQAKAEFAAVCHPTKKLIPIKEVAELAAYLCSDSASCISGSPIPIDGGNMAR